MFFLMAICYPDYKWYCGIHTQKSWEREQTVDTKVKNDPHARVAASLDTGYFAIHLPP